MVLNEVSPVFTVKYEAREPIHSVLLNVECMLLSHIKGRSTKKKGACKADSVFSEALVRSTWD